MRLGTSAESIRIAAEGRRHSRENLSEEAQYLLTLNPEEVEDLNADDGSGNNVSVFVFGLNSPFDGVPRLYPGPSS